MTEPSQRAWTLAEDITIAYNGGRRDYAAQLIDAALTEAVQAGPRTTVTSELGKPTTCRVVSPDGVPLFDGVDWSALNMVRQETRSVRSWRLIADQERAHAHQLQAERDELRATVERVRALADSIHAEHSSGVAWTNLDVRQVHDDLRDALQGKYQPVWDNAIPPGGMVCNLCGMPVETEPCREHASTDGVTDADWIESDVITKGRTP